MLGHLRDLAEQEGASLMGVAPVERFEGAPRGHHPQDFISKARSVVVFGLGLLPALVNWQELMRGSEVYTNEAVRKTVAQEYLYTNGAYEIPNDMLESLALRAAMRLQGAGHRSIFFPVTYGLKFRKLIDVTEEPFAPFSHRHAAVRAGLGEFGLNNLVVTPQFGPRCRFISVITEAELPPTPLLRQKVCLGESCSLCLQACPSGALQKLPDMEDSAFALSSFSTTNRLVCRESGVKNFCKGVCLKSCPVGQDGW
ncbi:MAG: hypothetical protein Q8R28_19165 [Dehalococcoidia bacterium]|nr:hypothetical protein [Dehalococcoidia bacterium]